MANIFLQLNQFCFKKESLETICDSVNNKELQKTIDEFFASKKTEKKDYANILVTLFQLAPKKECIYYLTQPRRSCLLHSSTSLSM